MAHFIDGGALTFNALAYCRPHPGTLQFLAAQRENTSRFLNEAGERFFAGAQDLYERFNSSHAVRAVRAAGRALSNLWQLDEIRPLVDIGELQNAPPTMQRWIMAEPEVRRLYHQQRIDGYSHTYQDMQPGAIGEEHYDYRRVMDGMVVVDEVADEDGEYGWTATTYLEELLPDDNDLDIVEQVDITDTWQNAVAYIRRRKEDPTDRFGAEIG